MQTLTASDLETPYSITAQTRADYQRNGYVKLSSVLSPTTIEHYKPIVGNAVAERSKHYKPLAERNTYDKAFLQIGNLWTMDAGVRELVFSTRLARIATELMGCRGVRLYHDQALYKEPSGGFTPWHCDQRYWPMASANSITAWIPLQAVPVEMGPLQFAVGSQHLATGRDLAISDESETVLARTLANCPKDETPYAIGDVSFHAGWNFHRAGPNRTTTLRAVMTVIYMDIDMHLLSPLPERFTGEVSYCCPGIKPGELIASPINPVLWPSSG